jgi:hypothetical protein
LVWCEGTCESPYRYVVDDTCVWIIGAVRKPASMFREAALVHAVSLKVHIVLLHHVMGKLAVVFPWALSYQGDRGRLARERRYRRCSHS